MLIPAINGKCYDLLRRGLELRFLCVVQATHFFILGGINRMMDLVKSLFKNPGSKIKGAILWLYAFSMVMLIIGLCILCLVILFTAGFGWFLLSILASAIILIVVAAFSWLSYITTYGLGELMENIEQINKSILTINANLKQQKADSNAGTDSIKVTTSETLDELKRGILSFTPSNDFKKMIAQAAEMSSAANAAWIIKSMNVTIQRSIEKEYISSLLTLSDGEIKEIIEKLHKNYN
jgi:hypothetical protein